MIGKTVAIWFKSVAVILARCRNQQIENVVVVVANIVTKAVILPPSHKVGILLHAALNYYTMANIIATESFFFFLQYYLSLQCTYSPSGMKIHTRCFISITRSRLSTIALIAIDLFFLICFLPKAHNCPIGVCASMVEIKCTLYVFLFMPLLLQRLLLTHVVH